MESQRRGNEELAETEPSGERRRRRQCSVCLSSRPGKISRRVGTGNRSAGGSRRAAPFVYVGPTRTGRERAQRACTGALATPRSQLPSPQAPALQAPGPVFPGSSAPGPSFPGPSSPGPSSPDLSHLAPSSPAQAPDFAKLSFILHFFIKDSPSVINHEIRWLFEFSLHLPRIRSHLFSATAVSRRISRRPAVTGSFSRSPRRVLR